MDKILRVDMTHLLVTEEPFPEEWTLLGGRGLTAKVLLREVDPRCDPVGAGARLVFAPGALGGSIAPDSGRMSVGGKSPLTGCIKESSAGGDAGRKLARLGFRAVIVEGKPPDLARRYLLHIDRSGARLAECTELKMLRTYAAAEQLHARFGKNPTLAVCGPAGELGFTGASVQFTDTSGHPSRPAARGGLGAVMGSKALKAIVIDDTGTQPRAPRDPAGFKEYVARFTKAFNKDGRGRPFRAGTPGFVSILNGAHSLPARNRRGMQYEQAPTLDGQRMVAQFATHGGELHGCMSGCIVKCSPVVNGADGTHVTSGLELETLGMCGSNLDIADLNQVARIDRLCDELGLDTIETGGALGVALEAGAASFGDAEAVIAVLERVDRGDPLAETIARGVVATCKHFGVTRVPAILGQGLPVPESRTFPIAALSYAVSAQGADHTTGMSFHPGPDPARTCQERQIIMALCDSTGFCYFVQPNILDIQSLYNLMYGATLTWEDAATLGWQVLEDEWAFMEAAGFPKGNAIPEWLRTEAIPSNGGAITATADQIQRVFKRMPPSDGMPTTRTIG